MPLIFLALGVGALFGLFFMGGIFFIGVIIFSIFGFFKTRMTDSSYIDLKAYTLLSTGEYEYKWTEVTLKMSFQDHDPKTHVIIYSEDEEQKDIIRSPELALRPEP